MDLKERLSWLGSGKGIRVPNDVRFYLDSDKKVNYHMADKGNRMYWCNCCRMTRPGGEFIIMTRGPNGKGVKKHKLPKGRKV